jgi:hypothetical protein
MSAEHSGASAAHVALCPMRYCGYGFRERGRLQETVNTLVVSKDQLHSLGQYRK